MAAIPRVLAFLLLLSSVQAQVNPSSPAIAFFWATPYQNETDFSVPACSTLRLLTTANPGSSVQPVAPFYFTSVATGGVPEVRLVEARLGGAFTWVANLPVGTTFLLAMTDSGGNTGGAAGPYTIIEGTSNCTAVTSTSAIAFTQNPPSNACGEIDITVVGGVKPYSVSVLAPSLGLYGNLTNQTSSPIKLGNIVTGGSNYQLFVTDSTGAASQLSNITSSGFGSASCTNPTPPPSDDSISLGAIVGGAVGGVLGAIALLALALLFFRRKKAQQAVVAHQQELNASAEYRMADGNAPLVTPFVVPTRLPLSSPGGSDESRSGALLGTRRSSSLHGFGDESSSAQGSSMYGGPTSPSSSQHPSAYSSHPSASLLPFPGAPLPSPSPSPTGYLPYDSHSSSYDPQLSSPTRDGLADPDDFAYRDHRGLLPPPGLPQWGHLAQGRRGDAYE